MNVDTRGIPILMLTAEEAASAASRPVWTAAPMTIVSKSVAPEILLLRVRALLRSSGARSSILRPRSHIFTAARILAIDDSPTYLESLAAALTSEGYEVTRRASGKEGSEQIGREAFDCVMVDLVMPEMDGIEVCRRINEWSARVDHSMAVIMLTACETKEDMTRGLEAGADDFVGKSSDMAVLKARIRALLRRKFFQEENRRIREAVAAKRAGGRGGARRPRARRSAGGPGGGAGAERIRSWRRLVTRSRTICARRCGALMASATRCSRTTRQNSTRRARTICAGCAQRPSAWAN